MALHMSQTLPGASFSKEIAQAMRGIISDLAARSWQRVAIGIEGALRQFSDDLNDMACD